MQYQIEIICNECNKTYEVKKLTAEEARQHFTAKDLLPTICDQCSQSKNTIPSPAAGMPQFPSGQKEPLYKEPVKDTRPLFAWGVYADGATTDSWK